MNLYMEAKIHRNFLWFPAEYNKRKGHFSQIRERGSTPAGPIVPKMTFLLTTFNTASRPPCFLSTIFMISLLILSYAATTAAHNRTTNISAIIDENSRIGKEVKTAMTVAVQNFNKDSGYNKFSLSFQNPGGNPLQAAYNAEELIGEKEVQMMIVGTQTWQEVALVAEVGNQAEVPILSLAAAAIRPPLTPLPWPFLIQMASNVTEEMNCIAALVGSFKWRRVIAIYEVDRYASDSGMLLLLSEALQNFNSQIEYRLVFPPFSSLSDPERIVREEVAKLLSKQSRVFIILRSSLSLWTLLFREAKQLSLMGSDSVWIIAESISSLLDCVNTSVIYSMEGALGIQTYFSEKTISFTEFKAQFRQHFRSEYPEEDYSDPGIYALRAYDAVSTIANAMKRLSGDNNTTSKMLLEKILSSNFSGLSGDINFQGGLLSPSSIFKIVNVVGRRYKELGFWSSKLGFLNSLGEEKNGSIVNGNDTMEAFPLVTWPGDPKRVPKGWTMPTDANPMKIGVPGRTYFEMFVKVERNETSNSTKYSGFCIDVFNEVLNLLHYSLPYEFVPYNGTYDELVNHVYNKTFDAVIGDVTILANRSRHVEFTQAFAESSLTMIVPLKPQTPKAWIFLKPFTWQMWLVTGVFLIYTMSVVWFLERRSNPEFEGSWNHQLGTALWFTFSSLFFAHREKIQSNYTRVVVLVWLFVVLALNSSYTASLTSMLTVSRLESGATDIMLLQKNNARVGCDDDSFIKGYLEDVLKFGHSNIKGLHSEYDYPGEFESGNISVAFLELPYEKAFLNRYCKGYNGTILPDRFGGFGFVFQKGSPLAADFSEAILTLSEDGTIKRLESEWFAASSICANSQSTADTGSLTVQSFWGLYLSSGIISSICFAVFYVQRLYQERKDEHQSNKTPSNNTLKNKMSRLTQYFNKRREWLVIKIMRGAEVFPPCIRSKRREVVKFFRHTEQLGTSEATEIQIR